MVLGTAACEVDILPTELPRLLCLCFFSQGFLVPKTALLVGSFYLQSVQYSFTKFNLESFCYDGLYIFDGTDTSAPLIGEFCDTIDLTESWKSCGPSIHFKFISDDMNYYGDSTGFRIVWNEGKDQKR